MTFSQELDKFYSFSRYNIKAPFAGGFVEESALRYKGNCFAKVCAVPLDSEQYERVMEYLNNVYEHRNEYVYNFFAAATCTFHKNIKVRKSFTCLEFAVHVLDYCGFPVSEADKFTVSNLEKTLNRYTICEGTSNEIFTFNDWSNDDYISPLSTRKKWFGTLKQFGRLCTRLTMQ